MKQKEHRIREIQPGSIGEELELAPGDVVLAVNGQELEDVFDYEFLCRDEYVELLVRRADGEEVIFEIEKEEDEELGIVFENGLMDEYRSCRNRCVFCFIDQMPPGMRETLYFKDDDARLSFLQGNYITLTNLSENDLNRLIRYRMEPINISIHTMNPELRCRMLHNRFAGEALQALDRLREAELEMNGQIVLCPGYNDGPELRDTLEKLTAYLPYLRSVSVVPVGLTRYREKLTPLAPVTPAVARQTISLVEEFQRRVFPETGLHFVHASDEFYLLAREELPEAERYDGYPQLENGVGTLRLLWDEFQEALEEARMEDPSAGVEAPQRQVVSVGTGQLAAPWISRMARLAEQQFPGLAVHVYPVANTFFGESITVAGLVTGGDLIRQLAGKELGSRLLLPVTMLRSGEQVFLDDVTVEQLQKALQVPVNIVKSSGADLLSAFRKETNAPDTRYPGYEL